MAVTINGTTGISGVDGSASTPALQGSDSNTGIHFPAADTVAIDTGGSERLRVNSSGQVGIGTTSPDDTLHLSGSTGYGLKNTDGTHIVALRTVAGGGILKTASNHSLVFGTNDTERARIDSSGRLLVGTSSSYASYGGNGVQIENSTAPELSLKRPTTSDGNSLGFLTYYSTHGLAGAISCVTDGAQTASSTPGYLRFMTTPSGSASSPTERMKLASNGDLTCPGVYSNTTANAANVVVSTSPYYILRSTSSIKYKTDVETIEDIYSENLLNCRPVWFRSTCTNDNPGWGYWGFIAEEVAEIDPRLVHWKTTESVTQEDGSLATVELESPEPESVQYDRFVPHLLNLIKRQNERIESLETRLNALEGN